MKILGWYRTHRKKKIAATLLLVVICQQLIFTPEIHSFLSEIRAMQSDANTHMTEFLNNPTPVPELSPDATFEEECEHYFFEGKGPIARMPLKFDANRYLEIFDRLTMTDGYVLDYIYETHRCHAFPMLYARLKNSERLSDYKDYEKAFGEVTGSKKELKVLNAYLSGIRTDGSRQGFIQLVALSVVGRQFYLFWHALYDDNIILSRIPARVTFTKDKVIVKLILFSKWEGVYQQSITFRRSFPHEVLDRKSTTIIPYYCGVMY